ncbi:MAG: family 16 glycosylhydrolase [Oscillospiraceae bacterium]|nr:family 16 glycosylhydrolase [Oscillospiraceae bacterium]
MNYRYICICTACALMLSAPAPEMNAAQAAAAVGSPIVSMEYYSANDGPVLSESGVRNASYGFVMPIFNQGNASWEDVADDLMVNIKVGTQWKDIDSLDAFVYNQNWGHWFDAGFTGYWFMVDETTEIQLASKSNPTITLNYTLEFTKLDAAVIQSMTPTQGPVLTAGATGGSGFTYPVFNGDAAVTYEQVADDLLLFVKAKDGTWMNLDNNAASGWIYDQNFGQFQDGPGGYWFTVSETTYIRLQSKSNPDAFCDYTILFDIPKRTAFTLTVSGDTAVNADKKGAVGISLPKIDGGYPVQSELDAFVYEVLQNGKWISLDDTASGFLYRNNGYSFSSTANQWGYWADGIYGLWFQPITEDMQIRIGYPTDGIKGHTCGTNYITYHLTGNPDAPRPNPHYVEKLEMASSPDEKLEGWNLIWNDEFSGTSINTDYWTHETGYYLGDDPNTWGWGNNELEYYTDSPDNSYVKDGVLTLKLLSEPKIFPQDANRTAPYSSGKLISRDKFSFKYGRIDFCARLPVGNGIWPALWMLPNDNVYGTWAASGEIDVMEAKGRVQNEIYGTIHYGGTWPANKNTGNTYLFPEDTTYADDYHIYSCIWEKDKIRWYVDGICYSVIPAEEWYSAAAPDNPYAPFDQEFCIILNLAAGGNFDGGITPDAASVPSEMQIDYVRVYQAEGDKECSCTLHNEAFTVQYIHRLQKWLMGQNVNGNALDYNSDGKINGLDLALAKRDWIAVQ